MRHRTADPVHRIRGRLAAGAVTALAVASVLGGFSATSAQASVPGLQGAAVRAAVPAPPAGFTTTFSDDFSGAAGSGVPSSTWKYDTGTGFGTGEVETMTSSTSNVHEDGAGHLVITALHSGSDPRAGWTSGRIESTSASFGAAPGGVVRMESVLQQPNVTTANGAGYWPAFWMLGAGLRQGGVWPSIGEVDALEDVNGRSSTFGTLHCGTNPGGPCNESTGIGSGERSCAGCQTGFHRYAVEIDRSVSPEQIRWYLDGTQYFAVSANQVDASTWSKAVDHPFFLIYDLAMGGGFPDAFGGGPTAATVSGGSMVIDSVAVYNKGPATGSAPTSPAPTSPAPTASTAGTITGIGGKCVDVAGNDTGGDGSAVQLWNCSSTAADQHWAANGSSLRTLGRCLDVAGAGTTNGTPVQLATCSGNAAQVWRARSDGSLLNPQSGRCLDSPGASTANGARLQIYDCNGTAAQRWTSGAFAGLVG